MCGICGYISRTKYDGDVINKMTSTLSHRGPDDHGVICFDGVDEQVCLGHSRLSILDLTPAGHQPMVYLDLTIVYNGEVYNYDEIRKELVSLGHSFVSHTDTEVILHAFKQWGKKCVDKFIGMFAFAIYAKNKGKVYLCRDRAGVKPLFYYENNGIFIFGSELKALVAHPQFKREVDETSLASMFALMYIPMNKCIYKNANKLEAGSWLEYDVAKQTIKIDKYWDISDFYALPKYDISYDEAKSELKKIMKSAFNYRMIADVPVGVFLSGGYDSTLLAAVLTKELGYKLDTFTIGFHHGKDEAPEASAISEYLGTNHNEYYMTERDAAELVPQLPYYYDEPYNNPNSVAFMLVSKLAKQKVACSLSADGADEIFGGYDYYVDYVNIRKAYAKYERVLDSSPSYVKTLTKIPYLIMRLFGSRRFYGLYEVSKWKECNYKNIIKDTFQYESKKFFNVLPSTCLYDIEDELMKMPQCVDMPEYPFLFDFKMLMCENYLAKIDRGAMWCSLECREPMLDQRILEFGARLPMDYKLQNKNKKRILKDIAYDYIPRELLVRPKSGFVAPMETWMRTSLKDYMMDTLSDKNVEKTGFNKAAVHQILKDFMKTGANYSLVWSLLQYHAWYNRWM